MAIALDASTPGRQGPTVATSQTSGSFSPPGDSVVVIEATVDTSGVTNATITYSNNGTALTWLGVQKRGGDESGEPGTVGRAYAIIPPGGRAGLTVTMTSSITGRNTTLKPYVLTGVDLTDVLGNILEGDAPTNSNVVNTTALTTARANSWVFCGINESQVGPGNPTSSNATIAAYSSGGNHSGYSGYRIAGAAGSSISFNADAAGVSTAISWNYIVAEFQESAVTHSGAVALSVAKTLTVNATLIPVHQGAVAMSVGKTLTAAGNIVPNHPGAVAMSVGKTLTAQAGQAGSVSMSVGKTLTAAGFITLKQATVSLSSAPTLTVASPMQLMQAAVQLNVTYTFASAGSRARSSAIVTRLERPPYEHPFRIVVQEVLSGVIVDWDLPVQEDFTYTRQLSGPTIMNGSFKPELISVQELGLDGYAYWFHVEINEEIRATAMFMPPMYEEQGMSFTCEGFSAGPHYSTWQTQLSVVGLDVFSVVRSIWNHVQSDPKGNYGVIVDTGVAGQTVGKDGTSAFQTSRTEAANLIAARITSGDPILANWTWTGAPPEVIAHSAYLRAEFDKTAPGSIISDDFLRAYAQANPVVDPEPYSLVWWEAPNCGEQIDELAQQTPFDYKERSHYNTDKTDVVKRIDLGYPRIGTVRADLVFDDENILEVVAGQEDDDTYASEVIVIGAGEGTATIRGYASTPFEKRVKKTYVHTDKKITTKTRADAVAASELGLRRGRLFEVAEIVVRPYHNNAPLGSYDLGDDIYVYVDVPWLNVPYGAWYRITSLTIAPSNDIVRIGLDRSNAFQYGLGTF